MKKKITNGEIGYCLSPLEMSSTSKLRQEHCYVMNEHQPQRNRGVAVISEHQEQFDVSKIIDDACNKSQYRCNNCNCIDTGVFKKIKHPCNKDN